MRVRSAGLGCLCVITGVFAAKGSGLVAGPLEKVEGHPQGQRLAVGLAFPVVDLERLAFYRWVGQEGVLKRRYRCQLEEEEASSNHVEEGV